MTNCAVFGVFVHKRQEQENLKIISMAFGCTHLKYDLYERVSKMHEDFFFSSVYRAASDTSMLDEECLTLNDPRNPVSAGGESTRGTYLTVPPSMQRSIQKYRENHDAFLCLVSHEALGSFNPWAIADRFESNNFFINNTYQLTLKCGKNSNENVSKWKFFSFSFSHKLRLQGQIID